MNQLLSIVDQDFKTEHIAKEIQSWGLKAGFYHGGVEVRQKKQIYNNWKNNIYPIIGCN